MKSRVVAYLPDSSVREADAAELRVIEEMRRMGQEALQAWASGQVERTSRESCQESGVWSEAQFGEGRFDKGVFVSIPFDAFLTRSSNTIANFVWKPLTRDGGAKPGRSAALYDLTGPRSDRTLRFESAPPPNHATIPADRRDAWSPPPAGPEPYLRVTPKPAAEQWTREETYEHRLEEALPAGVSQYPHRLRRLAALDD